MILRKEIILFIAFTILSNIHLVGQQKRYEGDYEIGDLRGYMSFEYEVNASDTILNGPFEINNTNLNQLITEEDSSFTAKGMMRNGMPINEWQFDFGAFSADSVQHSRINNFRYSVDVHGTNQMIRGNVLDGKLDGRWAYKYEVIAHSKPKQLLAESEMGFKNGKPSGSFQANNAELILAGRFLSDGKPHDSWELYSRTKPQTLETWHFSQGSLISVKQSGKDSIAVHLTSSYDTLRKQIPFDDRFFQIYRLRHKLSQLSSHPSGSLLNQFLLEIMKPFQGSAKVLQQLGLSTPLEAFKVEVSHYPLSSSESILMDSISAMQDESRTLANNILTNTHLNILKLSNQEAAVLLAVTKGIEAKYLSEMDIIVSAYKDKILQYAPREKMLQQLWGSSSLSGDLLIEYQWQGASLQESYILASQELSNGHNGVQGLFELMRTLHYKLLEVQEELEQKLQYNRFEKELEVLEDTILMKIAKLNRRVDSLKVDANDNVIMGLSLISKAAIASLADYSALTISKEKPEKAHALISCLDVLYVTSLKVSNIPYTKQEIGAKYMDDVWNPFTATIMTEQVKKRILESYEQVLIPHIYQSLNEKLSCDNAESISLLITSVHKRMFELREEDTKKLERKLKNEKDAQEVMSLMNITLNTESK